ncbi:uncharacterized protein LY89DRAFT_225187 [Mollisia scopiformis]|uniref:Uncharacterized protein n=1 Tax=Mollisia scopiformis TaxID=149040 RepID=A0A194WUR9_MOLSC|nr:uncharacterized protein LY89DRAFT_225187 [Mollisia scopiformis]KUJ11414.1 hypothetical protein LY89DRAFT_225187 [Mollisia scopiformis]
MHDWIPHTFRLVAHLLVANSLLTVVIGQQDIGISLLGYETKILRPRDSVSNKLLWGTSRDTVNSSFGLSHGLFISVHCHGLFDGAIRVYDLKAAWRNVDTLVLCILLEHFEEGYEGRMESEYVKEIGILVRPTLVNTDKSLATALDHFFLGRGEMGGC